MSPSSRMQWVFSSFGASPVTTPASANDEQSDAAAAEESPTSRRQSRRQSRRVSRRESKRESKRDSEVNSQRASAGSSTLNTAPSRSQTAESVHSFSAFGNIPHVLAVPAPASFYSQTTLRRSMSLDESGNTRTPHPSWPLPESILTASPTSSTHALGHARSMSNSGRRRSGSIRTRGSIDRTRASHERLRTSHEILRTSHEQQRARAGYISPTNLENLEEAASSPPKESTNEEPTFDHTTFAKNPERPDFVQERTSSRNAPTITSKHNTLRDVKPSSQSSRALEARRSQQAFLSPRDIIAPVPGSRSRDTDATALPRFLFSQDNLEEQLAAAQMMQSTTPPLSMASAVVTNKRVASKWATELYTISYLILFSIFGTLARLGLQWLTFYPGAPVVTSVLWPNFAGSLLLGLFAEDRRLFRQEWGAHSPQTPSFDPQSRNASTDKFKFHNRRGHRDEDLPSQVVSHNKVKKTIPLFVGLATGFCGSLTSFSAFMRDAFLALSNNLPTPVNHPYPSGFAIPVSESTIHRNSGYTFMAVLAVILVTLCLCLSALKCGAHIAILLDPWTPTFPFHFTRRFVDPVVVFLAFGTWLGAVVMTVFPPDGPGATETWRGDALFACVFAPLGCLIRYYTSQRLNGLSASFPLGTFAVNIFGTAVEGMAFDLQHITIGSSLVGLVPCQLLQGVMDGFCGSLTTVSTFVLELNALKRNHSYVYGISSIVGGLTLMLAIMGSVRWGVGWSDPICLV